MLLDKFNKLNEINSEIRLLLPEYGKEIKMEKPNDVIKLLIPMMSNLPQEEQWVLCIDDTNRLLAIDQIYIGIVNEILVRVSEILRPVIIRNAPKFIMVHNHPSGDPTPSDKDIELCKTVLTSSRIHNINFADSLVIGQKKGVSIKDKYSYIWRQYEI